MIIFLIVHSTHAVSQNKYKSQSYYLMNSGFSKVKIFVNDRITEIWEIDSSEMKISKHTLYFATHCPNAPKYDDQLSTRYLTIKYYDKDGNADSSLSIDFEHKLRYQDSIEWYIPDTIPDSSFVSNSYSYPPKKLVETKNFVIENGQKKLYRTFYYGYDSRKRVINLIDGNAFSQTLYTYISKRRKKTESIVDGEVVQVLYQKYNRHGQLIKETVPNHYKIRYKYNSRRLLEREVVSGKERSITKYVYQ